MYRNNAITTTHIYYYLLLRFYATESFLNSTGDVVSVMKSAACIIVHDISVALAKLCSQIIKMSEINDKI